MQNSKVILEKHKQFSVSSCRPLLTINALFGLLIANKTNCQIFPWNRWHKLHTQHLEKRGVSIHSTIKKTVETLNDVSLKFEKKPHPALNILFFTLLGQRKCNIDLSPAPLFSACVSQCLVFQSEFSQRSCLFLNERLFLKSSRSSDIC